YPFGHEEIDHRGDLFSDSTAEVVHCRANFISHTRNIGLEDRLNNDGKCQSVHFGVKNYRGLFFPALQHGLSTRADIFGVLTDTHMMKRRLGEFALPTPEITLAEK